MSAAANNSLSLLLDHALNSVEAGDGELLAEALLLDPLDEGFDVIKNAVGTASVSGVAQIVAQYFLEDDYPRYFALFNALIAYIQGFDAGQETRPGQRETTDFRNFRAVYSNVTSIFKDDEDMGWFVPVLMKASKGFLALATRADQASRDWNRKKTSEAMTDVMKPLQVAAKSRGSARDATFALCNLIFKQCFDIENLRLCGNILSVTQQQATRLRHFPKVDQVMYHFWVGRLDLAQVKIGSARENLKLAFDKCTNNNWKTKRTIFIYLLATSLMLGIFPHPTLLEYFDLVREFGPVLRALKLGDIAGFKSALDSQRSWFARRALYIHLRDKCEVIVWRSLFRRTLFATLKDRPRPEDAKKPPTLFFRDLLVAFRFSARDNSIDVKDVECIAANLMDQGHIKAYILHSSSLIVLHKDLGAAFGSPFIP